MPAALEDGVAARKFSLCEEPEPNEYFPLTGNNGSTTAAPSSKELETTVSGSGIAPAEKLKYPWYIIFILGNEFCERFSYYGMKAVLTIYFLEVLLWSPNTTTLVYHSFTVLAYFTPIFGAMLADGFLGKFNTIFLLSIVYVSGLVLLTLAAIPPLNLDLVTGTACGLLLIALGTGGIKPVVPAYGGDQFRPGQEKQRGQFFSIFYFSINAGSLISTFVTPILRSDVPCFGAEGCYPLAFGLPAGLLAISVLAFLAGRPFYRNLPSKENVIAKVFGCTFGALYRKIRKTGPADAKHWLDNADPKKYSPTFVKDVKQLVPVLAMFLPLPMFWALFDQQGSRWTLQATRMDGRVTDSYYWKPDQVQIFNPVLILALIPVFEGIVFPTLDRFNIPFKELARMVTGMILAGVAFVISGIVQMQLDGTLPAPVVVQTAELRVYNTAPCSLGVAMQNVYANRTEMTEADRQSLNFAVNSYDEIVYLGDNFSVPNHWRYIKFTVSPNGTCGSITRPTDIFLNVTEAKVHSLVLGQGIGGLTQRHLILDEKVKPKEGKTQARFVLPFSFNTSSGGGEITLINRDVAVGKKGHVYTAMLDRSNTLFNFGSPISNSTKDMDQGKYEVYYPDENSPSGKRRVGGLLELPNGGVYTVLLKESDSEKGYWIRYDIVSASSLSVFWQLPQYFVITVGEVLFSVSGLSFAYSQAPVSMKSVLQAGWLLTVAFGNVIVLIISGAELVSDQATEFFLFAGLIGAFAVLFAVMCHYYVYVDNTPKAEDEKEKSDSDTDSAL
ncbi:Solute carrier family 15 member 2 [Hypsibius exemplaris]|uniref:Oligopeptide transporter 1 n=1 Tax=Hypsibius exemplaris TaxID=2072580 RepID=A0A1W0WJ16_HYPEX|nr:Solute carrier family 15 member 2 [Hypsibius exemplaris]